MIRRLKEKKLFYGWIIVITIWFTYIPFASIPSYGGSIMNAKMVIDENLSPGIVGAAGSVINLVQALFASLAGLMIARKGVRFTHTAAGILMTAAYLLLAFSRANSFIFLICYALFGIGIIGGGIVLMPAAVNAWFDRKKALAMSIACTSSSIGGAVVSVVMERMTNSFGWRWGWGLAGIISAAAVFTGLIVLKEKPEDVGSVRDGYKETEQKSEKKPDSDAVPLSPESLIKSGRFHILVIMASLRFLVYWSLLSYAVLYAVDRGFSTAQGAAALSSLAVFSLIYRIAAGFSGRFPLHYLNAFCNGSTGIGCLFLVFSGNSLLLFSLGCGLIGGGLGMGVVLNPLLLSKQFSNSGFALNFGIFSSIMYVYSMLGPVSVAFSFSITGSYNQIYLIYGILGISAVIPALLLRSE